MARWWVAVASRRCRPGRPSALPGQPRASPRCGPRPGRQAVTVRPVSPAGTGSGPPGAAVVIGQDDPGRRRAARRARGGQASREGRTPRRGDDHRVVGPGGTASLRVCVREISASRFGALIGSYSASLGRLVSFGSTCRRASQEDCWGLSRPSGVGAENSTRSTESPVWSTTVCVLAGRNAAGSEVSCVRSFAT
jgi:hypothetical protein